MASNKRNITARIINEREITRAIGDIAERPKRAILVSAARLALKPMVREGKKRVPKRTGALAKSLGVVTSGRRGNRYAGNVVFTPRTSGKYDGWYAHIVEGGASGVVKNQGKGVLRKGSIYRKDLPAKPFFQPTVKATIQECQNIYAESINKALERRIKRLRRQNAKRAALR